MTRPEPDADGIRRYGKWAGNTKGRDEDQTRCTATVWSSWQCHQCQRKRGHGADGLWCKQHAPENIAKREAERKVKYDAQWQKRRLEFHGSRFYSALQKIAAGHNDPRSLATEIINDFEKG